ncbi:MAG: hypothetical protein LCH34_11970 [Firmicutes bacterium]|nr:hypothetical protein [Bacillota bacterium]
MDFTGRVRYIEKNYRNGKEIGEYIYNMLTLMNNRLAMLGMINSMEYEYNSFSVGQNPAIALNIKTGIERIQITNEVIVAIKEIVKKYNVSYSDIAILFPVRQKAYLRYYFLYWLEEALKQVDIPYSLIISTDNSTVSRTRFSDTKGVVISTIESSLGLDFKAVILAGLYPYNYVFPQESCSKEIKSWAAIKNMNEEEQNLVQSQMRSIYTACSRARELLYVISDLKRGSPMEEIISKSSGMSGASNVYSVSFNAPVANKVNLEKNICMTKAIKKLSVVTDHVLIKAVILETNKDTTIVVDLSKYSKQKKIIGKQVGDIFSFDGNPNTYKILEIISN